MGFTKRFEQLLSNPSIDGQTINWLQEYECDICGAEPLKERADFTCSLPRPGCGSYWQYRYEVCLDCVNAGIASFADRLRKHAQTLEEKARELRGLADGKWQAWGAGTPDVSTQDPVDDELPSYAFPYKRRQQEN
jgi:hypothetical protein